MKKIRSIIDTIIFFVVNFVGNQLIPKIEEIRLKDVKIIPYDEKYSADLIKMWNSWEEASFCKRYKYLLKFFGKRTCFLMIDKNEKLMGFAFFYFHFDDLKNHRIHTALGCVAPELRRWGCGALLLISAWNSFKKTRRIRGVSSRYTLSNTLARKLHEESGFKILKKYFDEDLKEERVYAVYDY